MKILSADCKIHHIGETSKKKMCKFHDNLQIGWGGHGLKTHFKKDRNCDKSPRGGRWNYKMSQFSYTKILFWNSIKYCNNMINLVLFHQFYAEDIKIKEYDYFSGFFKFKWCLYAYWYGINATTNIETFVTIFNKVCKKQHFNPRSTKWQPLYL